MNLKRNIILVLGYYFERYRPFRELYFCCCFRPNPYIRMCVSTIGSHSTFGKNVKHHGKSQVESWVLGFSLIFELSVFLKNSSRIIFPPSAGGPLPGPQGVRMDNRVCTVVTVCTGCIACTVCTVSTDRTDVQCVHQKKRVSHGLRLSNDQAFRKPF